MAGKEPVAEILPTKSLDKHYPIAFNLLPQIDIFMDNNYSKEEMKMVNETHKIFHDDTIAVTPTTVRVPVFRSHAESIYVETEKGKEPNVPENWHVLKQKDSGQVSYRLYQAE